MNSENPVAPASGRRPTMIRGLVPSLPERGKIKIGIKGKMITSRQGRDFQPPQKLDHFVVTTLERGSDGNFLPDAVLMKRLGDKPTEIPIRLLYDDPTLNFPTRLACFVGRTLWCSGDGEVATRLTEQPQQVEEKRVELRPHQVACPCFRQDPAYTGRDKCKMNGALNVLIEGAGGLGGVWKFRTTSYNSIVGIMTSLQFLASISGGVLANIPLKLKLQAKQATSPTDGSSLTIYVVNVTFEGETEDLQELAHDIALRRAKTHVSIEHIQDEARRALALMPPANVPLPGDDLDDITEEFYPEQVEPEPEVPADDGLHQPEPEPEFTVVDNDGNEFEFARERAVKALHAIFKDAGSYKEMARLTAAYENNKVTIERLTQEGAGAEAAALMAYHVELRDLIPVPARTASVADPLPFPGDLPSGERLVPREVPPASEPEPEPKESYLIEPPVRAGKPDWRAWAKVLFLPKLRQQRRHRHYALFLGDNEENLVKAQAALSRDEWKELEAAKDGQWEVIKQLDEGPA